MTERPRSSSSRPDESQNIKDNDGDIKPIISHDPTPPITLSSSPPGLPLQAQNLPIARDVPARRVSKRTIPKQNMNKPKAEWTQEEDQIFIEILHDLFTTSLHEKITADGRLKECLKWCSRQDLTYHAKMLLALGVGGQGGQAGFMWESGGRGWEGDLNVPAKRQRTEKEQEDEALKSKGTVLPPAGGKHAS